MGGQSEELAKFLSTIAEGFVKFLSTVTEEFSKWENNGRAAVADGGVILHLIQKPSDHRRRRKD